MAFKFSRELKTGIVGIGGILLFILGYSYLKSSPLFDNSMTLYAVYDHVGGLQSGTTVSINGFQVGQVKDIRFLDASGKLLVTISVDGGLAFSNQSLAELFDTGIIGGKGIQILPKVTMPYTPVQSGDTLPTQVKPGLTELLQQQINPLQLKVESMINNADSVMLGINQLMNPTTRIQLQESISGLNQLIAQLNETTTSINTVMGKHGKTLDRGFTDLGVSAKNLASITDSINRQDLGATIRHLGDALTQINVVLDQVNQGKGSLGQLAQNEDLYQHLSQSTQELALLLQDMRLNPKRYVHLSVFGKKQKAYEKPSDDPAHQSTDTLTMK
jgi:phospholipid/cholesterol/gamma-HCH transport system substrate-binding protein